MQNFGQLCCPSEDLTVFDDHLWTFIILYFASAILCMFISLSYRAVCSGVESRLRRESDDGSKKSKALLSAMERSEKTERNALFVIFLFNAASAIFAAVGVTPIIFKLFPTLEGTLVRTLLYIAVVLLAELIVYILSVIIPKYAADNDPAAAYAVSSWLAVPFFVLFSPLAALSSVIGKLALRAFGINASETENVTEDEIMDMIDAGEESGNIEAAEKEMIENVFEFSDITAYDVMTHRTNMEAIPSDADDSEIQEMIKTTGFSRFPVYEEDLDTIIGVLYSREYLLDRMAGNTTPIKELIHEPLVTPERVKCDILFREMQKNKVHLAIVLDEYGGTSGLVTMEDLLEEIFGNIYDEFDVHETTDIEKIGENLWRVAGSVDLETLSETIGCKFDEEVTEDYDTLGGLVFSSLSLIPDDGELPHVQAFGLDIKVEVFAERRVEWATVSIIGDEKEDGDKDDE